MIENLNAQLEVIHQKLWDAKKKFGKDFKEDEGVKKLLLEKKEINKKIQRLERKERKKFFRSQGKKQKP